MVYESFQGPWSGWPSYRVLSKILVDCRGAVSSEVKRIFAENKMPSFLIGLTLLFFQKSKVLNR